MTDTDTIVEPKTHPYTGEPGDHELNSHYVPNEELNAAILEGRTATALCGKQWVPTRDPERFPICPECKELYEAMDAE